MSMIVTSQPNILQYLDANNLYGWSMSQPLPTGEFKSIKCDGDPNQLVERFAAKEGLWLFVRS